MVTYPNNPNNHVHHGHMTHFDDVSSFLALIDRFSAFLCEKSKV